MHNKPLSLVDKIYYVDCPKDNTVLVAMNVCISKDTNFISWFDTTRFRNFEFSKIVEDDNNIIIYRSDIEENPIYTLVPLTLDLYNQKIKKHMLNSIEYYDLDNLSKDLRESIKNY